MQRIDYSRVTTATVAATATVNSGTTYYEPVDLATAVNYMKQNYGTLTIEDTLIKSLLVTSRHWIEERTHRAIVRQTITYLVSDDEEPILNIVLPFNPVVGAITSVKRVDNEGTKTTLVLNTDYYVRGLNQLTVTLNRSWSTGSIGSVNSQDVEIIYEAGYPVLANIPAPLVTAILKLTAENYINREDSVDWSINQVPMSVLALIGPYTDIYI